MGRPVILSDNVFNPRIYTGHALSASSTASGTTVLSLSSGQRDRQLTGWFGSALDTDAYVQAVFDQPRGFDLLWIDRDHNLAGESLSVRISDDGFTTYSEIGPLTVPSTPTPMGHLLGGSIVMTNEGALLWWLDLQVAWEARVFFPAMGAGLRPEIAGLMLGKLFRPVHSALKPFDWARYNLTHTVTRSELGQAAMGDAGRYRFQQLSFDVASFEEYLEALYPIEDLFLGRKPTVVIPDDERAEGAAFVVASPGEQGFYIPPRQYFPRIDMQWEELEPVVT